MPSLEQDENILKSALAFVVLRRRLKARKKGLPVSSALPFETVSSESYKHNDDDENENYEGSYKNNDNSNCDRNERENGQLGNGGHCEKFSGDYTPKDSHNMEIIEENGDKEVLPFLNGIHLSQSSSPSSTRHISSMLQVAKSTTLSLYSNVLHSHDGDNNGDGHDNGTTVTYDTSCDTNDKLNKDKSEHQQHSIHHAKHENHHPSQNLQSSSSNHFSIIYDFKTASMSKVRRIPQSKQRQQQSTPASMPSSSTTLSSSSSSNTKKKKSTTFSQSSYAVLDGILLHITSQLRTMKKQRHYQQKQKQQSDNENDHVDTTICNDLLYSFTIQNLLGPIFIVLKNDNNNNATSFHHHSNNNHHHRNNAQKIQNILSICTILHRLVLFDTSLSSDIITVLCDILRCLYYNDCYHEDDNDEESGGGCGGEIHGRRIETILLAATNDCNIGGTNGSVSASTSASSILNKIGTNGGGNSDTQEERNVSSTLFTKQSTHNHAKEQKIRKRYMVNASNHRQYDSVQLEDVVAVNCLILLEQIIGMSFSLGCSRPMMIGRKEASTANTIAGRLKQDDIIGNILSTLNSRLGPDLMIPVSTNDMACLFVTHKRRQRNDRNDQNDENCVRVSMRSDGGLNVGAKMMIRLYIYDMVQKLSYHYI